MELNFRLWLETSLPRSDAYWISPSGTILASAGIHIEDIWNNPEKFGFSQEHITALHAKHGEQRGQEGEAREELMLDAMKRGWIRLRKRTRPAAYWIAQLSPNRTVGRRITNWILDMFDSGHMYPNEEIRVAPVDGSPHTVMSAKDYLGSFAA
jgi:hypothetical protein